MRQSCLRLATPAALAGVAFVLAACAGPAQRAGASADATAIGRPADRTWVERRSWEHEVKEADGGLRRERVVLGWDYGRALAIERHYDVTGQLLSERQLAGMVLRATEEEQEWAFDLVRRHPDLRASVTAPYVHLYGGFIHMLPDDPHCHEKSRCVYVFASLEDGSRKVAQAIVDLQSNQVVYPHFEPETTRPLD